MSAIQVLTVGYVIGAAVFAFALAIILVRLLVGETQIEPGLPLIGGFVLMFGSKLAGMALQRRAGRN